MGSRDNTFENGMQTWPPVPFLVLYIVHYYFERRHRGLWRFGPSMTFGMPRRSAFLPIFIGKLRNKERVLFEVSIDAIVAMNPKILLPKVTA